MKDYNYKKLKNITKRNRFLHHSSIFTDKRVMPLKKMSMPWTPLKGQDTRFDLAESGIIEKILMSRVHGRPLQIFKVLLYIFY